MNIQIRPENKQDYHTVEQLTRNAFRVSDLPGCMQHPNLHRLRQSPDFIPALSLVATLEGTVAGHAAASKATIRDAQGIAHEVLWLAPLSVDPALRNRGIGGRLIRALLDAASSLGHSAIIMAHHPACGEWSGFPCTEEWGITMPKDSGFPETMLVELRPGALDGIRGVFHPSSFFESTQEGTDACGLRSTPREQHGTATPPG